MRDSIDQNTVKFDVINNRGIRWIPLLLIFAIGSIKLKRLMIN